VHELYKGAKYTKLVATILLMNACTVHGVSNNFVDKLLILLQGHIFPQRNILPKNFYATRRLTAKLGLAYNTSMHARKDVSCLEDNLKMLPKV